MSQEFDVVCLGGGVAGEAIAAGLRDSGLTLAVVERELVGGECPYWGCVPSKTLLRSGETLTEADRARVLAASCVEWTVDFPRISTRVLWMARNLDDSHPAAAMEATGARLFRGEGKLRDLRTVEVGGEQLTARRAVVIANGSTAAIPRIPGLDTVEYWTSRQATLPRELPVSLAILGGGAIGVELGQAFARLGSRVTVIEAGPTFLGLEEPEAGAALRPHLEADGMMLVIGDPCIAVEQPMMGPSRERSAVVLRLKSGATVRADRLLVATGRRPNVEAWQGSGLPQTERGWLKVDSATLEAAPGVFGAGDVTGLGGFTHLAYYHGQVIARRLRGLDATADHTAVPRVTFTDPEVASVGLSEATARARGIDVAVASADPAETARGYIHDFHCGALKLVADCERGVLIGATLVTPRAGEIVGELVLAIKQRIPLTDACRRHSSVPCVQPRTWAKPGGTRHEGGGCKTSSGRLAACPCARRSTSAPEHPRHERAAVDECVQDLAGPHRAGADLVRGQVVVLGFDHRQRLHRRRGSDSAPSRRPRAAKSCR